MLENCRIYVCYTTENKCIKFNNYDEYQKWCEKDDNIKNTKFYPICNNLVVFDKFKLMMLNLQRYKKKN